MDENGFQDLGRYPAELKRLPQNGTAGYQSLVNSSMISVQQPSWRSFDTVVQANIEWAANSWPSERCLHHLSHLASANVESSLILDGSVITLNGLNNAVNQGLRPEIKLMILDTLKLGMCLVQRKSAFPGMKSQLTNETVAFSQLVTSAAPDPKLPRIAIPSAGTAPITTTSKGKLAGLAYAAGQPPMYNIERVDPNEVIIKYLYCGPNKPLKFAVFTMAGELMTDVRVITPKGYLKADGRGELFISTPTVKAFSAQLELYKTRIKLRKAAEENTPYMAFQHAPSHKSIPGQPQYTKEVYKGGMMSVRDVGRTVNDMDEVLREGAMDAFTQNLRNWKRGFREIQEGAKAGDFTVTASNFARKIPILPSHLANYSITAPLGQEIVPLTKPPESTYISNAIIADRNIICCFYGVSPGLVQPPENGMGPSSVEQIAEYGKGIDQDRQTDVTDCLREIIATLVLELNLPRVSGYVNSEAEKKSTRVRAKREFMEEQTILRDSEAIFKAIQEIEEDDGEETLQQQRSNQKDSSLSQSSKQSLGEKGNGLRPLPSAVPTTKTSSDISVVDDAETRDQEDANGETLSTLKNSIGSGNYADGNVSTAGAGITLDELMKLQTKTPEAPSSFTNGAVIKRLRKIDTSWNRGGNRSTWMFGHSDSVESVPDYDDPTDVDFWLKILFQSFSISVQITPGYSSIQKEEARVAAEMGYLPREEYTKIVAASLGLNPEVTLANLKKQKEQDQAEADEVFERQQKTIASAKDGMMVMTSSGLTTPPKKSSTSVTKPKEPSDENPSPASQKRPRKPAEDDSDDEEEPNGAATKKKKTQVLPSDGASRKK